MSFEDTRWDIEQTVIKPLRDFRQQVAPLNRLPPDPKGPSGDSGDFLRMVGIAIGATGVVWLREEAAKPLPEWYNKSHSK